jgi:hypothetical protein
MNKEREVIKKTNIHKRFYDDLKNLIDKYNVELNVDDFNQVYMTIARNLKKESNIEEV